MIFWFVLSMFLFIMLSEDMLVFLLLPFSHTNDGCVCTLYLDLFTSWCLIEITPYHLAEIVLFLFAVTQSSIVRMYCVVFKHSPMFGHLCSSQYFTVTNDFVMNKIVYIYFPIFGGASLGEIPRNEIAVCWVKKVNVCVVFLTVIIVPFLMFVTLHSYPQCMRTVFHILFKLVLSSF